LDPLLTLVIAWLGLDLDCKRMGDAKTIILPHQERKVGSNAVLIVRHAVKESPEFSIQGWAQIPAAMFYIV